MPCPGKPAALAAATPASANWNGRLVVGVPHLRGAIYSGHFHAPILVRRATRVGKIPGLDLMQREAAIPKLSGDIRPLIPKLGLHNYWYPAIAERAVGWRKPVKVTLLGEELCLFRGANGHVTAIQDVCPHRGARLSEGRCHYRGTVACPYHGWVFDESGKNVAVLSEGPDSAVCGKPGTEARITRPSECLLRSSATVS